MLKAYKSVIQTILYYKKIIKGTKNLNDIFEKKILNT